MTEETPVTGLAGVLDRATDRIHTPHLAATALTEARRRRVRNHTLMTTGAAVSVVVMVVGLLQLQVLDTSERPVEPSTPSVTPSVPDPTDAATPDVSDAVQARWDPLTVTDAPYHKTVLPARLDPPAEAPSVADQPMPAAVVAWPEQGEDLRILGTDGSWRSVPGTADAVTGTLSDVVDPALSSDGRQVAMSTNDGILVVDVTSGEQRTVPWPDEVAGPWDTAPGLLWLPDEDGFAILHWRDTWLVGLDGESRKAPYGGPYGIGLVVDPSGTVVERRWDHFDIRVWRDDHIVSTAPFPYWGERLVARYGRVALTGGGGGLPLHGGPLVVDAGTGELLAYAPIRDPHSAYSDNGFLTAKGFLDEDTVLLLVGPIDFSTMDIGDETWHLVAWDIRTGAFERLTSGDTRMRDIDVTGDVLAADWAR